MKHVRHPRLVSQLAACSAAALALALAFGAPNGSPAGAQAGGPPPPPAPNATTPPLRSSAPPSALPSGQPVPTATPAPRGRRRKDTNPAPAASASANPEPSATPTSPAFATLDGTWEFQLQFIDRTEYSYLTIVQGTTGALTGSWKVNGKQYPFEGTYDGRLIKLVVKEPTGNVTMNGYVEGASDMVGLLEGGTGKPEGGTSKPEVGGKSEGIAFTAEHRASAKGSIFKKGV